MNLVALVGNMVNDIEMRETQGGKTVGKFRIAVARGRDDADFLNVTCWDRTAEVVRDYAGKGKKVGVEGRIQTGSYEKDGETRYTTEVVAHRVHLLSPKSEVAEVEKPADNFDDLDGIL